jgi:predicted acylesterase/phospholipase RssA
LFDYLEGLRNSGFFKQFRHVVFTGTSMGGYAACAFCSLSPGSTVLAYSQQSTLAKDLVSWEKRLGLS